MKPTTHNLSPITHHLHRYIHKTTLVFIVALFSLCLINSSAMAQLWEIETVDSAGDVGLDTSLAFHPVSGYPYISYYDVTNHDLKYARYTGAAWSILTVDSTGNVGSHTSLAFDANNYVAISYFDLTNGRLRYAIRTLDNGVFTWHRYTVDDPVGENVGLYTSLAFDTGGRPAISYYDSTNDNLKFAHDLNGDRDFADAGEIIIVDSKGNVGECTSLAFDASGNPAISYYKRTGSSLKFAHDTNGDGDFADAGEIITVDSARNVGLFTSLAFDPSGNPAISYYNQTNRDLKFAHDTNGDGDFADAGEIITVDSIGRVGLSASLAFDPSGNPAISYYKENGGDLKFANDINGDGDFSDPGEKITVDSVENVGVSTSLAFAPFGDESNDPTIAYYDLTNDDLKLARLPVID